MYGVANLPDGQQTIYFADGPFRGCAHEPEDDRVGWRAMLAYVLAPAAERMARDHTKVSESMIPDVDGPPQKHDATMTDVEDAALDYALRLLFAKGSEGDGELHLNTLETRVLATYVRHLRMRHAGVTYPTGICGEYVSESERDDPERPGH